ncbi:oligosaccharide flippase family protein [Vibrio cyclitrophicus]|uniref:oligosaccharide flippase family protein n=1 Tax=Vibrio cyclitrophicus TaxID=47951 RepID=UPI000C862A92|nr:oligosaccharide flippase family protein [Vibrio cyclitrophicus]PMK96682.1 hypothetical protein BCT87_09310 [Vibrio cyclitrophicus]
MMLGSSWQVIGAIVITLIQFFKVVLIARYLTVADFGVYSIFNIIFSIFVMLSDSGMTGFSLYKKNKDPNSIFTYVIIALTLGLIVMIFQFYSSNIMGSFFEFEYLAPMLLMSSFVHLCIPFSGMLQSNILLKGENKEIVIVDVISYATSLLVLVMSLNIELNLMSIAYSLASLYLSRFLILILISFNDFKGMKIYVDIKLLKSFINYSKFHLSSQVINQIKTHIDSILIAKIFHVSDLGVYSLAKQLVTYPTLIFKQIISKYISPKIAISTCKGSDYLGYLKFINVIVIPVYIFIWLFCEDIINIIYGPEFLQVSHYMGYFCIIWALRTLSGSMFGSLCQVTGNTKIELKWNLITFMSHISATLIFVWFGIDYLILSLLVLQILYAVFNIKFFLSKIINIDFFDILKNGFDIFIVFSSSFLTIYYASNFVSDLNFRFSSILICTSILYVFLIKYRYFELIRLK